MSKQAPLPLPNEHIDENGVRRLRAHAQYTEGKNVRINPQDTYYYQGDTYHDASKIGGAQLIALLRQRSKGEL